MYTTNSNFTKITVTLNGEPVGNELLLDSVTFRPVTTEAAALEIESKVASKH
ncbi:hypothetical protein [Saccharibacillus endophyticus]|uniref:Uncharacterized protein n=1 Tax=Saccharibacillus endophyticus TaxID=2060666 RepID=A0ABQ1ZTI6_9BACL|nr:hypothetical protein [Saccharibacillus endophyticus]GGH76225.1 hypothetical protein GCM10007362_18150 [Saccharibacillus endophyticus]